MHGVKYRGKDAGVTRRRRCAFNFHTAPRSDMASEKQFRRSCANCILKHTELAEISVFECSEMRHVHGRVAEEVPSQR